MSSRPPPTSSQSTESTSATRWAPALLAWSGLLLLTRLHAADNLGYGDAEALYALYARHPQAVYVDHPGLIGLLARAIGRGEVPSPSSAHGFTAVVATLAPWLVAFVARTLGASWRGAVLAALVVAVTPMTAIGLYALTPDLPLFVAWYLAVGCAARALASAPGSLRALCFALAAGLATGLACDAKVSGGLLLAGLAMAFASPAGRPHLRTIAPYAALAIALFMASPAILEEIARGYPMMRHRLLDPRASWGVSIRNLGALVGGQALYLSPLMLAAAIVSMRDLHARRNQDAASIVLWSVTVASLPLLAVCLISRVAEPHWPAPIYLALPLHLARSADVLLARMGRRLATWASVTAFGFTILAHAWVLWPVGTWLAPSAARYDLANDLVTWRDALPSVRQALLESTQARSPVAPPPVIVASHWTLCAQLGAGLPRTVLIGCNSPAGDDWDVWLPREIWREAPVLLYVTDSRMPDLDPSVEATRRPDATWTARIVRGGLEVRTVTIRRLVATGLGLRR